MRRPLGFGRQANREPVEPVSILLRVLSSRGIPGIEVGEFDAENGRLDFVQTRVNPLALMVIALRLAVVA